MAQTFSETTMDVLQMKKEEKLLANGHTKYIAINRNLGSNFFDIIAEIRVHGTFSATEKRKTKTKSLELKFDMMDPIWPIFSRKQSKGREKNCGQS